MSLYDISVSPFKLNELLHHIFQVSPVYWICAFALNVTVAQ